MATAEEWRQRGADAIQELLRREHAVTQQEMEAKLADRLPGPRGGPQRVQPHHLTTARRRLLAAGAMELTRERTRGSGRVITTFNLDDSKKSQRAAGRKRLLQARFHSWSQASSDWGSTPPISAGLERVVQASLQTAAPHGYRLLRPAGGEVTTLLNAPVPGGSLDNAAFYTGLDELGLPTAPVHLPIEAKNVRQWIYPQTQELFQVLSKSARLQQAHPTMRIVPVLVCREKHTLTALMAEQMGFHVISTWRQYLRPIVATYDEGARDRFEQVRDELGFNLELHEEAAEPMVGHFTTVLPRRIHEAATRWATVCGHPDVPDLLLDLRRDELTGPDRHQVMLDLGEAVGEALDQEVPWAGDSEEPEAEEPDTEYYREDPPW